MSKPIEDGESIAAKGGKARAAKLSATELSASAKKAADARWGASLPKATHGSSDHPLKIGGVEIPCYVLEDGRRVITNQGIQIGLNMSKSGGQQRTIDLVASLERKVNTGKDLLNSIMNPIHFRPGVGARAFGYEATVLADLCDLILAAREKGLLRPQQSGIAAQCEVLVRAFARVGIIALVDEATGYQYARTREELQRLLERYISKELARWQPTFDPDFYKHMFRLKGWRYDPHSSRRPFQAARLTVDLAYDRIHPDLLKELKQAKVGWEQEGGRKGGKLHQFLTMVEGHPRLKQHLEGITALMKVAQSWGQLQDWIDQHYPKLNQTLRIPFPEESEDEPAIRPASQQATE